MSSSSFRVEMAKIIRKSGTSSDEWPLAQEPLTIGRRPDNHIVLPDTFASGRHAMVGYLDGRYFIEDLKSSNGTILNGQRVGRSPLKDGDVIYIGQQRLEFSEGNAAATEATTILQAPLELIPPPPPPPPKAPPADVAVAETLHPPPGSKAASALPGFNFIVPVAEPEKSAAEEAAKKDLLEGLVGSIRAHREREQQEREAEQAKLQAEWVKVMQYASGLEPKFRNDTRVKYFNISTRSNEVVLRVQRDPRSRTVSVMLSREHPDHRGGGGMNGIWLRSSDDQDTCFPTADTAIAEMVRSIAFLFV